MVKANQLIAPVAQNALARKALESVAAIHAEAQRKKNEQVDVIKSAIEEIEGRMALLSKQRNELLDAVAMITGRAIAGGAARRPRNSYLELRERVVRWLGSQAGRWFAAAELEREFPELEKVTSVAIFLKKAVNDGRVKVDQSGGKRNTKYAGVF